MTDMIDAAGTSAYAYTAGNQLWTEDGPWASDTVTNTYNNRLRTGLILQRIFRILFWSKSQTADYLVPCISRSFLMWPSA